MRDRAFLDTNILIYFYSENEPDKRNAARLTLKNYDCLTSIQALSEASNVWFKKSKWSGLKIREHLNNIELACNEVIPVKKETINKALELKDHYGYSYYDCLMLASALEGHCSSILTEDMRDGQIIDGKLRISNPFKNE